MKNLRAIILAAGKGTRMKSETPKVLHKICGKFIVQYVLDMIKSIGSLKTFVVLGHKINEIKKELPKDAIVVKQSNLSGTADAVRCVARNFKGYRGDVIVLCGDAPALRKATLKKLVSRHKKSNAVCTFLTAFSQDPGGYGRIIRKEDGEVSAIREDKDAVGFERDIGEINVGVYCFDSQKLFCALKDIKLNKKKKEYYLTDLIEVFFEGGLKVETVETEDEEEGLGINTKIDLSLANKIIRRRILNDFMLQGVTIVDPDTTYIDAGVKIGNNTIIRPCTFIESGVRIGSNCLIGPCARIRPGTRISNNVEIGNFAEITASKIGSGVFMKHFSYLGDAIIGKNVNIGAGVVTANFDGKNKHTTKIADGAFIGSDSILISPVNVGKNAITAAGSVVTKRKTIPENGIAIGVPARIIFKKR
ncbi:MAG: NTP transferase domain-containing protein [Candidatus Zapsychrus exili]|nr:NTP transferase domain-containing protein [Candidatus Zapsychrus exili]